MAFALEASYRNALLQAMIGGGTLPTIPTSWSLGLYAGNPLTGGTELSGGNYARQSVSSSFWSNGAGSATNAPGTVTNTTVLRWPATGTAGAIWDFSAAPDGYLWLGLHDGGGTCRISMLLSDADIADRKVASDQYLTSDIGTLVFFWIHGAFIQDVMFSVSTRLKLLRYLLAGEAFTIPATWTVGLYVDSPFFAGTEVYDPEYAALAINNDGTDWSYASGVVTNAVDFRWPASGWPVRNWGIVTHLVLSDSGNQPWIAIKLRTPISPGPGEPVELAAGSVFVTTIF